MNHAGIETLEHASRSTMAYWPDDRPAAASKLLAATLPAVGILAACAVMLFALV